MNEADEQALLRAVNDIAELLERIAEALETSAGRLGGIENAIENVADRQ